MQQRVGNLLGRSTALHILLLLFAVGIVFSNTLENDYHLDSVYRIEQNTEIDRFWPPARFFTDRRTGSTIPQIAEYRPMMPLSHAINSEISRLVGANRLAGFHAGNILIHALSAVLAYFLFRVLLGHWGGKLSRSTAPDRVRTVALAGALIFAVHPISGSAVNYLAARDLLLMVFFMLASFLVYATMRVRGDSLAAWASALLLLSLAILSKQAAIMGFGFVFLFEWVLKRHSLFDWRLWARVLLFSIPTAGYFFLRWFLRTRDAASVTLRVPEGLSYPFTMLDAHLFYYLRNFAWPFEMRALARVEMLDSLLAPTALIGLVFILATLAIAWLFRKKEPLVSFCILAYWLFMALESSIFPFRYVVTDYRQYLSSVFLSLLVALLVFSLRQKWLSTAVTTSLVLYFAVSSYVINRHWETEESFWKQSVTYGADALAHQNYGMSIVDKDPDLAEFHYREALKQHPNHVYASISLAMLELRRNQSEQALERLRRIVRLNPTWAMPYYWLSVAQERTGDRESAAESAVEAARRDPRSISYQFHAAMSLRRIGQLDEAVPFYRNVVALNPDYRLAEFWLAFTLQKAGDSERAIASYRSFLERNPEHVQARFNLAYEEMKSGDCTSAIADFTTVLELQPTYLEAHRHMATCYARLGEDELARQHRSKSRRN